MPVIRRTPISIKKALEQHRALIEDQVNHNRLRGSSEGQAELKAINAAIKTGRLGKIGKEAVKRARDLLEDDRNRHNGW